MLSIAIPTYDDHEGLWGTLAALRAMSQTRGLAVRVVDNNPAGPHADANRAACVEFDAGYEACAVAGNARAKDLCVRGAGTEYVMVMDSHVVLDEGGIDALLDAAAWHGKATMYQGPLRTGAGAGAYHTHFTDVWSGKMWGVWGGTPGVPRSPHGVARRPFEIQAQGMGLFVVSRDMWDRVGGFHPGLVGFAGEEWYMHTKFRNAGGRVMCVPGMVWTHRFHKPHRTLGAGFSYDVRYRNYVIALEDAGIPLDRLNKEYGVNESWTQYVPDGVRVLIDLPGGWDYVYALTRDELKACNLQVRDDESGFTLAVRYAQRKPDPYEGGQYDVVFCDGGKVNTYAQAGVRRIVVMKGDGAPEMPRGYWAYRATAAHTVYTCDPADAEPALPGLLTQARNLAVSLVTGGLSASTPELVEVRRAICASNGGVCPTAKRRLSDNRCSECGCALEYKIALAGQKCPDGHW